MFFLSFCSSVTSVYCAKRAEAIELSFGMVGRVGSRSGVLEGEVQVDSHRKGENFGWIEWHIVTYKLRPRGLFPNYFKISCFKRK